MMNEKGYTVLIDGYNVINKNKAHATKPLSQARDRLVSDLLLMRWSIKISEIILVFDGSADNIHGQRRIREKVKVIFALPDADSEIQRIIRNHPNPRRVLLVSDDREIMHTAKSHGSICHSASWLISRGKPVKKADSCATNDKKHLSVPDSLRITRELAKYWQV